MTDTREGMTLEEALDWLDWHAEEGERIDDRSGTEQATILNARAILAVYRSLRHTPEEEPTE